MLHSRTGDLFLRLLLAPEISQDNNCPLENAELAECELFMRKHQFKQPPEANQTVFLLGHWLPWALNLQRYQRVPLAPQQGTGSRGRIPELPVTRPFKRGSQKWLLLVSAECPDCTGRRGQSHSLLSCWATPGTPMLQSMRMGFWLFGLVFKLCKSTDSQMLGFPRALTLPSSSGYFIPQPELQVHIASHRCMSLFQTRTAMQQQMYCIYYFWQPRGHY